MSSKQDDPKSRRDEEETGSEYSSYTGSYTGTDTGSEYTDEGSYYSESEYEDKTPRTPRGKSSKAEISDDEYEEDITTRTPRGKAKKGKMKEWKDIHSTRKIPKSGKERAQYIFEKWARGFKPKITDFIKAWSGMPVGWCPSPLSKVEIAEGKPSLGFIPSLDSHGINFVDLRVNPKDHVMVPREHSCVVELKAISATLVDTTGKQIIVLARRLRVCLWNKQSDQALSSVHIIPAAWTSEAPYTWKFPTRPSEPDLSDPDFVPENRVIFCCDKVDPNICIMMELGLLYTREGSQKLGELSCGWAQLPLYPLGDGVALKNKTYEMDLLGGSSRDTPRIKLEVPRDAVAGAWAYVMNLGKKPVLVPRVTVKISSPSRDNAALARLLPVISVAAVSSMEILALFRQMCADSFLRTAPDAPLGPLHDPALAAFPKFLDIPQVLEALKLKWTYMKKLMGMMEKRNKENLKTALHDTIIHIAPLLKTAIAADSLSRKPQSQFMMNDRDAKAQAKLVKDHVMGEAMENLCRHTDILQHPGALFEPFRTKENAFELAEKL